MSGAAAKHVPVMLKEVTDGLAIGPGQIIVDGTLGGGGHTNAIAERVGPAGQVIALDRDPRAVAAARERFTDSPITFVAGNFRDLPEILSELEIDTVDGVLLDLGMSSDQLADRSRGFSFDAEGPLDMRYDPTTGEPVWRIINRLSAEHMADVLHTLGEERYSRRIARKIVERRREHPVRTASELSEVVRRAVPQAKGRTRIDPATRTFQALRMLVNEELESLEVVLRRMPECLRPEGRIAVISFHSLEDRRVKNAFRDDERYTVVTRKPLRPTPEEIARNPRSRSAKLRVASRT